MEVETRPPLVDGNKLGLHPRNASPDDLSLTITENDILLSDEERVLLQSPDEDIDYVKHTSVNGDLFANRLEKVPSKISCESVKCNGDVSSDSVPDASNVFRTENDSVSVCAKKNCERGETNSKSCKEFNKNAHSGPNSPELPSSQEESLLVCGESNTDSQDGPSNDVSVKEVTIENTCSLDASESRDGDISEQLLDSGLSPKSLKDFSDDVDEMEIPRVIDISSICVGKESVKVQSSVVLVNEDSSNQTQITGLLEENTVDGIVQECDLNIAPSDVIDRVAACDVVGKPLECSVDDNEQNESGVDVDSSAAVEDVASREGFDVEEDVTDLGVDETQGSALPDDGESTEADLLAEETVMNNKLNGDQEDGSPGDQGMNENILPTIVSENDDGKDDEVFENEMEFEDDGGSVSTPMLEDMENSEEMGTSTNLLADDADNQENGADTSQSEECEQRSNKKNIEDIYSSNRMKLKRRTSADNYDSPPLKVTRRKSSLDNVNSAEKFDPQKSLDEFKKLSDKTPSPPAVHVEPLDIPIDIDEGVTQLQEKERKTSIGNATISSSGDATKDPSSLTSKLGVKQNEQSVLVIDLDDDEEKPENSSSSSESQQELSKRVHRSMLDVLFDGKEEITMNREKFTRLLKSYISQYLLKFGELGKATSFSMKAKDVLTKINSNVSSYERQKEDFKSIMTKLLEDRAARKTWDETLVPPRATRSVGLQVCSVGSMYVKNNAEGLASSTNRIPPKSRVQGSSANQSQALSQQKQALAQQQMSMAQVKAKKAEKILNTRPIAKKSVTPANRPMVMKTVPATKPVTPIKPKPTAPPLPATTPKLNGLKAVTVTRNPDPSANKNASPLTVTTVSPNSRTYTLSNKGTLTLKSPQKSTVPLPKQPNPMLTKALAGAGLGSRGSPLVLAPKVSLQNPSKVVPIAVTHTPGTAQNSKNLASGPGRPLKTPPSSQSQPKKPASAVPDTTIDLTDLDDDVPLSTKPTTPSNTTARKSTAPARAGVQTKALPISKQITRHPALPPNPPNFNPVTAPPRPYLGICDTQTVTQGIMLTWHFNNVAPVRKISKFQVFAYQETKSDGGDSWKKVGDVDALPLPMACTLTQFREGYTYHFIVRALDETGLVGPFSAPSTITLMKKTV